MRTLQISLVRKLERRCSVPALYRVLKSFAFCRAALNTLFKKPGPRLEMPASLAVEWNRSRARRVRMRNYLNQYLRYFQDRLNQPRWRQRCSFSGLNHLTDARQTGASVVLAFCHFGPYHVLRSWLRAAGIPAAILIGAREERRDRKGRLLDQMMAGPDSPTVLYLDELRRAAGFLAGGIPLLIAVDGPAGRQMEIPFAEDWSFRMGTGAVRLAVRHRARLIPCMIVNEGPWQFRIELSPPVPEMLLDGDTDGSEAGRYLLTSFKPAWEANPDQCGSDLLLCLKRKPEPAK